MVDEKLSSHQFKRKVENFLVCLESQVQKIGKISHRWRWEVSAFLPCSPKAQQVSHQDWYNHMVGNTLGSLNH
jgi:hypothetical protein